MIQPVLPKPTQRLLIVFGRKNRAGQIRAWKKWRKDYPLYATTDSCSNLNVWSLSPQRETYFSFVDFLAKSDRETPFFRAKISEHAKICDNWGSWWKWFDLNRERWRIQLRRSIKSGQVLIMASGWIESSVSKRARVLSLFRRYKGINSGFWSRTTVWDKSALNIAWTYILLMVMNGKGAVDCL